MFFKNNFNFNINIWQISTYFLSTLNFSRCPVEGPDHHTMMYGGVVGQLHAFLTSALGGGDWSVSHPATLPSGNDLPLPNRYEVQWDTLLV
jgi:hypothetical protein